MSIFPWTAWEDNAASSSTSSGYWRVYLCQAPVSTYRVQHKPENQKINLDRLLPCLSQALITFLLALFSFPTLGTELEQLCLTSNRQTLYSGLFSDRWLTFILRQGFTKLPRLALNSLGSQASPYDPPASVSIGTGINMSVPPGQPITIC